MIIKHLLISLENFAAPALQESYDNATLITGDPNWNCSGILCTLDATEDVIDEAMAKGANLVVCHHPILFRPIRQLVPRSYVERTIIKAIKNDIAIYAIHTNLDNIVKGVNGKMAEKIGLMEKTCGVLSPRSQTLAKLYTYVPASHLEQVRDALFQAGGGAIGQYEECSFTVSGTGSFKPLPGTDPFIGQAGGKREEVAELKIEMLFPAYKQAILIEALRKAHPYEEVAYEVIRLENADGNTGSGLIGELPEPMSEADFLKSLKDAFGLKVIKHTALLGQPVKRVALCGGSGSFLTSKAMAAGADVFITADVKYHEFFDADGKILLVDIGHWESEQFTIELLANYLQGKFPTFAVLKTEVNTNPVHIFA